MKLLRRLLWNDHTFNYIYNIITKKLKNPLINESKKVNYKENTIEKIYFSLFTWSNDNEQKYIYFM